MECSAWCKVAIKTQTPVGGFQCILFALSSIGIFTSLQFYHVNDRFNFSCNPKLNDYFNQICYDNYISTVSKFGLIPLTVFSITIGVLSVCWLAFAIYGTVTLRKIKEYQSTEEDNEKEKQKFLCIYCIHVFFRIIFLIVMLWLFCSCQTIYLPSVSKCNIPNTSQTSIQSSIRSALNKTKFTLQCRDGLYKGKSRLNVVVVVIHAFFIVCSIVEVVHLGCTKDKILERVLGDIDRDVDGDIDRQNRGQKMKLLRK